MDHSEVRELLEDAAIEPGGLERLMAGDTPTASIVAGHLAGCPECTEELERLRRSVALIQPVIRAVPPPELRDRTLAFVAAVGRPRGTTDAVAASTTRDLEPRLMPHVPEDGANVVSLPARGGGLRSSRLPALVAIAAALIVAVTGTAFVVDRGHADQATANAAEIEALGDVARWTIRVDGEPDVQRIQLASAGGATAHGTIVFSPTSTEMVIVAEGLTPPAAGQEYRCWVEINGQRAGIGKMFFGGNLAYWVGDVEEVAGLKPGAAFGVSLVNLSTPDVPGESVLVSAS